MLTLSMIVKDEAETIATTLESVRPFVDAWVICDTGSTDGTQEICSRVLGALPGLVVPLAFIDFAATRNAALEIAESESARRSGAGVLGPPDGHVLWLDADDCLYGGRELRAALAEQHEPGCRCYGQDCSQAPAFFLEVLSGPYSWDSCRVVRAGAGWRFRGEVHEVLCGPNGERPTARIPGVRIGHFPGPEASQERTRARWERDVEILRKKPDDPRSVFYLAMTLMWLERWEEADRVFERRAGMGGWDEERYVSRYHQATCLQGMRAPLHTVLGHLHAVARTFPHRAEPLHALEGMLREDGCTEEASEIRALRLKMPRPEGALFLDSRAYGRLRAAPKETRTSSRTRDRG